MADFKTLDKQIATVGELYFDARGMAQYRILRPGMTRQEIIENFPPYKKVNSPLPYHREQLIKSIIMEAASEFVARPRKNIRGFWYERLMGTLQLVLGETKDKQDSIDATINDCWTDLVEAGYLTYSDLNIYSEKERAYNIAVAEDSPYPNVVVMVEKESFFDDLSDLANTFQITFVSTGGQSSLAAACAYIDNLRDRNISLGQEFKVFTFTDLDPEGHTIEKEFINHLRIAGARIDKPIRVGVRADQLGETIIPTPYDTSKQGKETQWHNWEEETGGIRTREGEPGRVEMDIFDVHIRQMIIDALTEHLDGFNYQIGALKKAIEEGYQSLSDNMAEIIRDAISDEFSPYREAIEELVDSLDEEAAERTKEVNAEIQAYEERIRELKEIKAQKIADITDKLASLDTLASRLDDMENEEFERIWPDSSLEPFPDDLIKEIEKNGGWREWAEEEIELSKFLDTDDLEEHARNRQPVRWSVGYKDQQSINEWVHDNTDWDYPGPEGPDEDPEELIAKWFNEEE